MASRIVTPPFKNLSITSTLEDMQETPHYVFLAKITQYQPTDITIPDATYDQGNAATTVYDDMIFGKKIQSTDLSYMAKKVEWESGNVYDQYSYSDPYLLEKDFYVVAYQGSLACVYKCLDNNNRSDSSVKPTGQDTSVFQTSDGYIWKYLYSFDEDVATKFETPEFMPIVVDQDVLIAAQPGTIDAIHIQSTGGAYLNHMRSSFASGAIRYNGDPEKYLIDTSGSLFNDFYNGCIILVTSGPATGLYKKIMNYEIVGSNKIIELESAFVVAPQPGDSYEIMPAVTIKSDGNETVLCVARAIIDPVTNLLDSIDILNPGNHYRKVEASIYTDPTAEPSSAAQIEASISPIAGHGSDLQLELGASHIMCSVEISGSENGKAPTTNDFRTIGILRQPLYNNLRIYIDGTTQLGAFSRTENIIQYRNHPLNKPVNVTASSYIIGSTAGEWYNVLEKGDSVLITDGIRNHYGVVNAVANDSFTLSGKLPAWSNTNCSISMVKEQASGIIEDIDVDTMLLINCEPTFVNNITNLLGLNSFATVKMNVSHMNNLTIHGVSVQNFNYFNQLYKIDGTYSSTDSFSEDEVVRQETGTTGVVHSTENIIGTDTLNLLDISGIIDDQYLLTSSSNLVSFTINNQYPGDLEKNSGEILYIENILPITRTANTSETVKILLRT